MATSRIFIIAFIAIIFLPVLFMQGMFMDGLIYSAVAKNLSVNFNGSFELFMSKSFLSDFHEQPPLAFFMQAIVIKLFGDIFFVDRLYSFLCLFFSLYLLNLIASKYTSLKENSWIAILAFLCIPVVSWSFKNNMLENTMCVFTLCSVYISVKYYSTRIKSVYIFAILISFSLLCSFMSKGFTGLFPLAFPLLFQQFITHKKTFKWLNETSLIVLILSLITILAFTLSPSFYYYIKTYFQSQVVASVNGNREVDGHFFIVKRVPQELLILILLTLLLNLKYKWNILIEIYRKIKLNKEAQLFFALALCGSLPIVISPKQSGYYVLCSYPFFALFFALINQHEIVKLLSNIKLKSFENKFRVIMIASIFATILLSLYNAKRFYRDEQKIVIIDAIANQKPQIKSIDIDWDFAQDYSLYAYFARRHSISLYSPNYQPTKSNFVISKLCTDSNKLVGVYNLNSEKVFLILK